MRTACFFVSGRIIVSLVFAVLICGFVCFDISTAMSADENESSVLREHRMRSKGEDPYNGGIKLAEGGEEPGKAYMTIVNAMYKKDYARICKLITINPAYTKECLQNKEAVDVYIAMLTNPKTHKVLGGYMKGDEATLNVAYTFESAPSSTGYVVMKKMNGKWVISSSGGSGSATVSAEVSGQADFGASPASETSGTSKVNAGKSQGAENSGPLLGKWAFEGKDDKGVVWKGTLTVKKLDMENYDAGKFHSIFSFELNSGNTGRGVEAPSTWDAGKQTITVISGDVSYTAMLSPDRQSLTQGKWTEPEMDWNTLKVSGTTTGAWSAKFIGP